MEMGFGAGEPRWSGEHGNLPTAALSSAGLSPLARGTRSPGSISTTTNRFIPAGAGNTIQGLRIKPISTVYPRWRGEHVVKDVEQDNQSRFIPAGAGNTSV